MRRSVLHIAELLAWADAYHVRTGRWPDKHSGRVTGALDETWVNIDRALRKGLHGLPGGWSLAQLLAEHRGMRNRTRLPPFTTRQVLARADRPPFRKIAPPADEPTHGGS
jgi:hypothetical protein